MRDDQRRRRWRVAAVLTVLFGLGGLVAWQVNDALGLRVRPADVPAERLVAAAPQDVAAPPRLAAIVVPDHSQVRTAADAVADALAGRGAR
ncbi:hypothetical protein, partial [Actinophytocola sp.]|uniref:hypothetical protein n=1 Tax=Actinophytocola sp. TaxID=1872138 RepID=UPI003D6AD5FA